DHPVLLAGDQPVSQGASRPGLDRRSRGRTPPNVRHGVSPDLLLAGASRIAGSQTGLGRVRSQAVGVLKADAGPALAAARPFSFAACPVSRRARREVPGARRPSTGRHGTEQTATSSVPVP